MTTRDVQIVESDLSGEAGAEPARFGLRDEVYDIDLTPPEKAALEQILQPYVSAGREIGPMEAKSASKRFAPKSTAEERAMIRAWAQGEGYELADRGQIPNWAVMAFLTSRD